MINLISFSNKSLLSIFWWFDLNQKIVDIIDDLFGLLDLLFSGEELFLKKTFKLVNGHSDWI